MPDDLLLARLEALLEQNRKLREELARITAERDRLRAELRKLILEHQTLRQRGAIPQRSETIPHVSASSAQE